MKDTTITLTKAAVAAVFVNATPEVVEAFPTVEQVSGFVQLLSNIAIGITTLWLMIKKPKPKL